ncbi:MAG: terminase large subunit [Magnetococcales bacterium]|nr:terminase large subunit [Magnetococcales bacterium]
MAARSYYAGVALRYAQAVVSGKITACRNVQNACARHLSDLEKFSSPTSKYEFNPPMQGLGGVEIRPGDAACRFIECLPHIKGPLAGKLIKLGAWQVFALMVIFGWVNRKDQTRRFRRVYIEVPRGNAKSTLSSAVALYMLLADGEFGAEVYSLATTRDQAKIVFSDAQAMARRSRTLMQSFGAEVGANAIFSLAMNATFRALSSQGYSLDGLNIHFGCIDELHAHKTRVVYDVVETGTGKRDNSLLWVITTAGSNRSGICYELRNYVIKVLAGKFVDDTQFGIIYGLDEGDDWTKVAALKKANPNWGVSVRPEVVVALQKKAMRTPSAVNNFLTKHLNEWVSADVSWMDMRAWDKCAETELKIEEFSGMPCWIGLDLASKIDVAAMALVFSRGEGRFAVFMKFYLPDAAVDQSGNAQYEGWRRMGRITVTPGNVLDFGWIKADLLDVRDKFDVRAVAFDPFQATQLSQEMMAEGMPMLEVGATVRNFSEPMKHLEALVLEKKLAHDGCPVLSWMASNVVAHRDVKDNIFPRKERPENKIDGIVALIMALSRAILVEESNELDPNWQLMVC